MSKPDLFSACVALLAAPVLAGGCRWPHGVTPTTFEPPK